jgi:activator of 2-hydroxyglutaryl-CoA dehydratase
MYLGLDIGSISAKFALVVPPGGGPVPCDAREAFLFSEPVAAAAGWEAFTLSYDRLQGDPLRRVRERLVYWTGLLGGSRIRGVAVTGKSGQHLAGAVGARYENEFRCLVKAVTAAHPDVRTIFEMGGENAKVIRLERSASGDAVRIRDYDANGDCAAGTGSFIDQQANRMNLAVEEIGDMVARAASAARIAGRCSVFAKSDMVMPSRRVTRPMRF